MSRPRVLVSRSLPDRVMSSAEAEFEVVRRSVESPMSVHEAIECLGSCDGAVPTLADAFTADAFAQAPNLRCKILANFGAGYNHIDVDAATNAGIVVSNTPGAVTDATADIGISLILMTARRTVEGDRLVRSGNWTGWHPTQMLGNHVTGKTVGIIGMGRIGKEIAKRCHYGFRMNVIFFNRSRVGDPGMPARQLETPNDVMSRADFIVVAVPAGPQTHHLIDASLLATMQSHAIFVNISRGDVVDETALISALENGKIGGAGLDVYEFEPSVPRELVELENVVLLPHLGTSVLEVRESMGMLALDNLRSFFSGNDPPNRVC